MPLGSSLAGQALVTAVHDLVVKCGGSFGCVLDEGNGLWCTAFGKTRRLPAANPDLAADAFYRTEIAPRARGMCRGTRLVLTSTEGPALYAAASFATIYVAVVWFDDPFNALSVHAAIRDALPRIEALTLALPTPSGPGAGEGVAKVRA